MKVVAYAYANGSLFADDWRSECVVKLTRNEQAEYGFTAPLVTLSEAEAAVKQARIDALEEAKQAVADVDEPGWTGYECPNTFQDGVHACAVAIESLKGTP